MKNSKKLNELCQKFLSIENEIDFLIPTSVKDIDENPCNTISIPDVKSSLKKLRSQRTKTLNKIKSLSNEDLLRQ